MRKRSLQSGEGFLQKGQDRGEVAAPDVAAIHYAERKQFFAVKFPEDGIEFAGSLTTSKWSA